jgi:hypothetical protein
VSKTSIEIERDCETLDELRAFLDQVIEADSYEEASLDAVIWDSECYEVFEDDDAEA